MSSLYKPSQLKDFLSAHNRKPKKSLSQVFLTDQNILKKIVRVADIQNDETLVEIGPGPGALTAFLLQRSSDVIVIEKDKFYASQLANQPNITVFQDDILDFDFSQLVHLSKGKKIKIVANIPYHISSAIVAKILYHQDIIDSAVLLVQKEFAKRLCAKTNEKDYGSLTVFAQFYADVKTLFSVSKNSFFPIPSVDSAVIQMIPKKQLPLPISECLAFEKFYRTAFSQRRKMLTSSLSELIAKPALETALDTCGFKSTARPQELTYLELLELYKALKPVFKEM